MSQQQKHDKYVAQTFDRQASWYDSSSTADTYQRPSQRMALDEMQLEPGMHVLDLGCGTGTGTLAIASKLRGTGRVVGIDLSEKMIAEANKKRSASLYQNVTFRVGSGHELQDKNTFDYVVSTNAFHHFYKKEKIFSRIYRALKNQGQFIIEDFCDDFPLMRLFDTVGKIFERGHAGSTTSQGLSVLLAEAGFVETALSTSKLTWFWGIMIGKGRK